LLPQLTATSAADWSAYIDHPFVRGLADGSLPEAAFRQYLIQDYLFLGHFARAYGLAAFKAESFADIRAAAAGLSAIIDREIDLHIAYAAGWGLTPEDMAQAVEAPATVAYPLCSGARPCRRPFGSDGRPGPVRPRLWRNRQPSRG
jgi:thiaminase/transcriptional activator TenA